ncbi:MAG: glycosyltransferase family 1 protein [Vicingaceae bacterium]
MRIAVNTRLLVPKKMDGIGRFSYESLFRISEQHPEVEFDFIFDRKPPSEFSFPKNVSLHAVGIAARHPILWYLWFEQSLRQFVNRGNYDLFLSPEGWIPPKLNCPSLGVIHDLNFVHHPENIIYSHRKYLAHFFPKYAQRADRIATVSEFSKEDIHQVYGIEQDKIDVVYNGANNIFTSLSSKKKQETLDAYTNGKPYFIFIGTLHPRKNLEHLFKAFDAFKQNDEKQTKLLIVGNRKWWPTELDKVYKSMRFAKEVDFLGRKSDQELAELLAAATALTYLPYFEGFGIPILEAFQSETAVITSNCSSMPEVAQDAALLCDPRNVQEISTAMQQISKDDELRNQLIEKGKERAKYFSWDKTAELLWKSMEQTLSHAS